MSAGAVQVLGKGEFLVNRLSLFRFGHLVGGQRGGTKQGDRHFLSEGPSGASRGKGASWPFRCEGGGGAGVFVAATGAETVQYSLHFHGELEMELRGPGRLSAAALSSGAIDV